MKVWPFFIAISFTIIAGCTRHDSMESGAVASPTSQPAGPNVSIDNFTFSPPVITITAGQSVAWMNHDDVPHTVTADDKSFSSKALDTDDSYSHQFTKPGTYSYFCAVHTHMTAQVIVKE